MQSELCRRGYLQALGASVLAGLAGCTGGGTDDAGEADDGAGTGSGEAGDGSNTWEPGRFDRPGYYAFEVYNQAQGTGTLIWAVERADEETATVTIDYDHGDQQYRSTHTVEHDAVEQELALTPVWILLIQTMYAPELDQYSSESLEVGAGWSVPTPEGEFRYEITGTETHAGLECYVSEVRLGGDLHRETCIAPDHGMALHTAVYDGDGEVAYSQTLTEYSETVPADFGGDGAGTERWNERVDWTNLPQAVPGRYAFEVEGAAVEDGSLVWDFLEERDGERTVAVTYEHDGGVFEATVTDQSPGGAVLFEPDTPEFFSAYGVGGPAFDLLRHHTNSIAVGDSFESGDSQWEVHDAGTHFDVLTFDVTAHDGTSTQELRVAPELAAPVTAWKADGGTVQYDVELIDFEPY